MIRGGLTTETLGILLEGEGEATNSEQSPYNYNTTNSSSNASTALSNTRTSTLSTQTTVSNSTPPTGPSQSLHQAASYDHPESSSDNENPLQDYDEFDQATSHRVPVHDQRTILITNLPEQTTHKDLASIIRGGRILDIFLRNDRSATISFVEGAAEFLAYTKRNDVYLHMKRVSKVKVGFVHQANDSQLDFRWSDRQFNVPPHVANKIANGATRNLVVRGVASKLTADQIRDHLDHIHNLVAVDINFKNGDAYISTNSVHNALFARTCLMSRTIYKGARIDYYQDECAESLPRPHSKVHTPVSRVPLNPKPTINQYALLDNQSEDDTDEDDSYATSGICIDGLGWTDTVVA